MIKIGKCYFSTGQIAAIESDPTGNCVTVYLVNGAVVATEASSLELQCILEEAGLISPEPIELTPRSFSHLEQVQLWEALHGGYLFAAKDDCGQVFAYQEKPFRTQTQWTTGDEGDGDFMRLHGEFKALSFEDEEPLNLKALFAAEQED